MEFPYVLSLHHQSVPNVFDKHCSGLSVRLENEHLGNIDQYRVTREVPLPYTYEDHSHESDGDEDDGADEGEDEWRRGGGTKGELCSKLGTRPVASCTAAYILV